MNSRTTSKFRQLFAALPSDIRLRARKAYQLWKQEPAAKSLYFKRVSATNSVYSVRVGLDYRALGLLEDDTLIWFWIGKHDDYERLLK